MAEKLNSRSGKPITSGGRATTQPALNQHWRIVVLILACFAVGAAVVFAWHAYRLPARITAGLPPLPSLTDKPDTLRETLVNAYAAAAAGKRDLEPVIELGRLYHANDFHREARACWELLRAEQAGEAQWCYYLADLHRAGSDYRGFEAMLRETVDLAPEYAPAWLQLAELEFKTGRMESAEHSYRQRLTLMPGDPYATLGIARVAWQTERRDEARKLVAQLVRDAPSTLR